MDWRTWIRQSLPRTEIMRGGATVWEKGAKGLLGDTLGPVMHAHDKASEVFYFVAGRCRLEIGNAEEFFSPGDFVLVPPDLPHNLWNAGDDDLLVFWIVAPHFANNKWYTAPFVPGAMKWRATRSHVAPGAKGREQRFVSAPRRLAQPGVLAQLELPPEHEPEAVRVRESEAHVGLAHVPAAPPVELLAQHAKALSRQRGQQCIAMREMPVGRVVRDPGTARHFAQAKRGKTLFFKYFRG